MQPRLRGAIVNGALCSWNSPGVFRNQTSFETRTNGFVTALLGCHPLRILYPIEIRKRTRFSKCKLLDSAPLNSFSPISFYVLVISKYSARMGNLQFPRRNFSIVRERLIEERRFAAYPGDRYAPTWNCILNRVKAHLPNHYAAVDNARQTIQLQIKLNPYTPEIKRSQKQNPLGPLNTDPTVGLLGGVYHISHQMLLDRFNPVDTRRATIDEFGNHSGICEINVASFPNRCGDAVIQGGQIRVGSVSDHLRGLANCDLGT